MSISESVICDFVNDKLKDNCGLDIHGVYEVVGVAGKDARTLGLQLGIQIDEVLGFATNDPEAETYRNYGFQASGLTSLVTIGGITKPIVFIEQQMLEHVEFNALVKYGVSRHELGHAKDMILGVSLKAGMDVNLAKAEAYAERFCLQRLDGEHDPISDSARNIFAKRLYLMRGKEGIKGRIFQEVVKRIDGGKISKWASLAIPGLVYE